MQNKYTCDVGDFGKYGMLRFLCFDKLKLGINWYLTPDETHLNDGNHIRYLDNDYKLRDKYICCDNELYRLLKEIKDKERSIKMVQQSAILPPGTLYYSEILEYKPWQDAKQRVRYRKTWVEEGHNKLSGCDIVFLDPDNGLEVDSVKIYNDKAVKYVSYRELADYYKKGQSIIIYNHRSREKQDIYEKRFYKIKEYLPEIEILFYLRFNKGTARDYIFILQPYHSVFIMQGINNMLSSDWEQHFRLFKL